MKGRACTLDIPENQITVALYIKKGFDEPVRSIQYKDEFIKILSNQIKKKAFIRETNHDFYLKFPPEQFYVDQLIKLSQLLNHVPLFVYVFTDGQNTSSIVQRLKKRVNYPNITFSCGQKDSVNRHKNKELIIQDLYNMSCFDCLIKNESMFTLAAQLIGDYKLVINPQGAAIYANDSVNDFFVNVDYVSIVFNNHETQETVYDVFLTIEERHKQQALQIFK